MVNYLLQNCIHATERVNYLKYFEIALINFIITLGFLSTEDEQAPGTWGLFAQNLALKYVKEYIKDFRGDPTKITIAGSEAGAASVGLHMVSPVSSGKGILVANILLNIKS